MKVIIDTSEQTLQADDRALPLYGTEAFKIISELWLKVGWNQKYSYQFTWWGAPIIQLPQDVMRYQEVIFDLKPDVVVETGIAHGGSALLTASLLKLIGRGRVVAVDIRISPEARARIQQHPLGSHISLIEGSAIEPDVVEAVKASIRQGDRVLVVLDSNHSYEHVMGELRAYAQMVTPGSYIVATDGVMRDLSDVPRGAETWRRDNPAQAAADFAKENPHFAIEEPSRKFNESTVSGNESDTYWPNAWLKRIT